ncbi:hypothetical protein NDU88_008649 [Pleurodeles waltl]|uniref:Uncharacterized protein n=1 Tax=Pleurodeles waltl TaxID=8319 RepID=A0AAV7P0W3_PLEWA|nr:hypothetical protein NDU88_008649 [Pleurodeles waltl]
MFVLLERVPTEIALVCSETRMLGLSLQRLLRMYVLRYFEVQGMRKETPLGCSLRQVPRSGGMRGSRLQSCAERALSVAPRSFIAENKAPGWKKGRCPKKSALAESAGPREVSAPRSAAASAERLRIQPDLFFRYRSGRTSHPSAGEGGWGADGEGGMGGETQNQSSAWDRVPGARDWTALRRPWDLIEEFSPRAIDRFE